MPFMQKQITDNRQWLKIDGCNGVTFVDALDAPNVLRMLQDDNNRFSDEDINEAAVSYTDETDAENIESVSLEVGYGARLSAPGYLDSTDWCVFPTREAASKYLKDLAGDDDTEDE